MSALQKRLVAYSIWKPATIRDGSLPGSNRIVWIQRLQGHLAVRAATSAAVAGVGMWLRRWCDSVFDQCFFKRFNQRSVLIFYTDVSRFSKLLSLLSFHVICPQLWSVLTWMEKKERVSRDCVWKSGQHLCSLHPWTNRPIFNAFPSDFFHLTATSYPRSTPFQKCHCHHWLGWTATTPLGDPSMRSTHRFWKMTTALATFAVGSLGDRTASQTKPGMGMVWKLGWLQIIKSWQWRYRMSSNSEVKQKVMFNQQLTKN